MDAIQHLRGGAKTSMLDAATMTTTALVSTLFGSRTVPNDQGLLSHPEIDLLVVNGFEATTIRLQKRISFLLERGYFKTNLKATKVDRTARLIFISRKNLKTLLVKYLPIHHLLSPPLRTQRDLILDALWRHGFHRSNTAKFLGISRKTLYNKIRHLGIDA
jgi:DNA-binding NtrC family response regulator